MWGSHLIVWRKMWRVMLFRVPILLMTIQGPFPLSGLNYISGIRQSTVDVEGSNVEYGT